MELVNSLEITCFPGCCCAVMQSVSWSSGQDSDRPDRRERLWLTRPAETRNLLKVFPLRFFPELIDSDLFVCVFVFFTVQGRIPLMIDTVRRAGLCTNSCQVALEFKLDLLAWTSGEERKELPNSGQPHAHTHTELSTELSLLKQVSLLRVFANSCWCRLPSQCLHRRLFNLLQGRSELRIPKWII